ncbi:MAG: sodium:calcium antiporter [Bacillota bacterium]|nr:sodium:calcium antiporter [Bacillota bacterium]
MDFKGALLLFALALLLTIRGGELFVDAAAWLAEFSGIPKFIVGASLVSLATTLPELLVSLFAALEGRVELAVGNAVGSVSANTGLILGLSLFLLPGGRLCRREYLGKSLLLLAAGLILPAASRGGRLSSLGCLLLLGIFLFFLGELLFSAHREGPSGGRLRPRKAELLLQSGKFLLGAGSIVLGSRMLVRSASQLALALGLPERIIAVSMVAIGTSLPELVTCLAALCKKQPSLSLGNIIGANLIDLSLILPLCSLFSGEPLPISPGSLRLDMPLCLLLLALALLPVLLRGRFYRWQGLLLLCLYGAYLLLSLL